ncbi:MAG: serine hydrolase [Vicinamibacterales bacterium]
MPLQLRLLIPVFCGVIFLAEPSRQEVSAGGGVQSQLFDWVTERPERQGMSSAKLTAFKDHLARTTKSLLVIRNDKIVYEWYAIDHGPDKPHYTASMAKALVAGLSLGVALNDGRLALDDPAGRYVRAWQDDPRKRLITLRHLGSHTSGLEDAEADDLPHDKLTGWKGDFWKRLEPPRDPFTIARDLTPLVFAPGERFSYSNPGIAMLSYAVTAAIAGGPHRDIRSLLRDRIMKPIGVADKDWSVGYNSTFTVDGLPLVGSWGGGGYTARAVARVGRLMLRRGDWDGRRLLSASAVMQISEDAGMPGHGGVGWWSNQDGKYSTLPRDAFWGSGAGHQVLFVVPSKQLVAVRNGAVLNNAMEHHDALNAELFTPLMDAIEGDVRPQRLSPYPSSTHITRVEWAPPGEIVRQAKGSDNFPLTWGDDDRLYTAYGDGWGFEPKTPEKLSLGLAVISGSPPSLFGANLRSPTVEQRGDGTSGKKASGLLMVDGILYLMVRNAGNSQLAWSRDRGRTWTWSDWKFEVSFGAPTLLNFGRNYQGARDQFVYVYSHDSDSAYEPADRMVLARVPKDKLRDRSAYQFFELLDGGRPRWTSDIARRGAVFTNPRNCYRSGISYNAGLRRYLWAQTLPGPDPRFKGGLALYDAAEPWGPWTTMYFADSWDVGPGESSSVPPKWMSADGKTVHLVFSGDDSFSVRQAVLVTSDARP